MSGGQSLRCLVGASMVALAAAKFSSSVVASRGWNAWTHPGRWLERVMRDKPDGYIINFGAHLNLNAPRTMYFDPVSVWQRKKTARGLAVDADDDMKWTGPGIARRTTFIEPAGVAALLNETRTPPKPRLLKVDIDSFDAVVVIAVLEVRSPDFVYVEINERAPPPTCYCNDRTSPRSWRRLANDAYGCSLQGYVNALAPRGYALVGVAFNNALFVRRDLAVEVAQDIGGRLPTAAEAFAAGYAKRPDRDAVFPWNVKKKIFYDDQLPLDVRLDAMEHYPSFALSVDANQATFVREADDSFPCRSAVPETHSPHHELFRSLADGTTNHSRQYVAAVHDVLYGKGPAADQRAKARDRRGKGANAGAVV